MAHAASARITPSPDFTDYSGKTEASTSAVSWPAIIAGAFVVSALSLILLALGTGVGLSSISPWTNQGVSASTVGKGAIVWMILVQIIASAMGGYLAGRLRTKWVAVHSHEVYFRDTAHGFLVWSVGLVVTAAFLASAATSMVSGTPSSGAGATVCKHGQRESQYVFCGLAVPLRSRWRGSCGYGHSRRSGADSCPRTSPGRCSRAGPCISGSTRGRTHRDEPG